MLDFIRSLFDSSGFPARWYCGKWSDGLGWTHIISDCLIFAAYVAIPITLSVLLFRKKEFVFSKVVWAFVAFIAFCGVGHVLEAVIFWEPVYRLAAVFKVGTAAASWGTVLALVPACRVALTFRSPTELEAEIVIRTRELASEKAVLEAILEALTSGVLVVDRSNTILLANDAGAELIGDPSQEQSKWRVPEGFFKADGTTQLDPETFPLARVLGGAPQADAEVCVAHNKLRENRMVAIEARPVVVDGEQVAAVAIFNDFTERERNRAALQMSNKRLQQFAYGVAHDLREPLRQMQNYGELLEESLGDVKIGDKASRYLRRVMEGASRMTLLLNDLRAYAKTGSVAFQEVQLNQLVHDVLEDLGGSDSIRVMDLPTVSADRALISQVFRNLLSNALKFTTVEPEVLVFAEDAGLEWVIGVKDNGVGIPEEHLQKVFKLFHRLHVYEDYPGTGIGLALCERAVAQHGGKIWVESKEGSGSVFYFSLPKSQSSTANLLGVGER